MALSFALILISIVLGVAGELLLKTGVNQLENLAFNGFNPALHSLITVGTTPALIVGFLCYGLAAIFWLMVLARLDLSYAYPFLALMYLFIPLASRFFLHEQIPVGRWVGVGIIIIGVLVVAHFGQPE
jgi:drug/metabolite transporter (DMT)-like permease